MYKLVKANINDTDKLIEYKLDSIGSLNDKIINFVKTNIPKQIKEYNMISVNKKNIGCLLYYPYEDGILLDELYIEKEYRNKGIGTKIINSLKNKTIYLYVVKSNKNALRLYERLGFKIDIYEENRYLMKYEKTH